MGGVDLRKALFGRSRLLLLSNVFYSLESKAHIFHGNRNSFSRYSLDLDLEGLDLSRPKSDWKSICYTSKSSKISRKQLESSRTVFS